MSNNTFKHSEFYASYPSKVIARPGYPIRAVYKSKLLFKLFEKKLFGKIDTIKTYADIGGCFGFGANAMSYFITQKQGFSPETAVFEIVKEFVTTGKVLFPNVGFIETKVEEWEEGENTYDLFTLFDVIEHVMKPDLFLQKLSNRCKYILIKTPMETSGEWFGGIAPVNQGENHEDGHINFWTPKKYEELIANNNFEIIDSIIIPTIVPKGANEILNPECQTLKGWRKGWRKLKLMRYPTILLKELLRDLPFVPWSFKRKILGGGEHICLCKSKIF